MAADLASQVTLARTSLSSHLIYHKAVVRTSLPVVVGQATKKVA